jgi:hypothetical protein
MCDYVEGEILFAFPDHPGAAEMMTAWFADHGESEHVYVKERLDSRLSRLDVPLAAKLDPGMQVWRVGVPAGQESFKSNFLRQHYQLALADWNLLSDEHGVDLLLNVLSSPNHLISLMTSAGYGPAPAPDQGIELTDIHARYKAMVGGDLSQLSARDAVVRVAVVDSGIDPRLNVSIARTVDVATPEQFGVPTDGRAPDGYMHGTAVASVIADVAPRTEFAVYRVADDFGRASEWDVIAALLTLGDSDVVNLSLAFGLSRGDCNVCGRSANSSRAVVFENALGVLLAKEPRPIVVAASGNAAKKVLSYPARFADVIAIGSVNSKGEVSSFSNQGALDQLSEPHHRVWFLPGGEDRDGLHEIVATVGAGGKPFFGTSFACAYASGVIAQLLAQYPRAKVAQVLATGPGVPMEGYDPDLHGHGLMTRGALEAGL